MDSSTIRQKYLDFFKKAPKNHKEIPPAPLIPLDDPTTLFTSAGMQQLTPYLKGESHSMGKRLVNSQPAFRAEDIEEVGDNRHTTFFEMLGNWSLGDYFKKEQLAWFWEFLIKELNLPKQRLYVTVFKGNDQVSKDEESLAIWKSLGVSKERIYFYEDNWWSRSGLPDKMPPGEIGGPDSEVFIEFTQVKHDPKFGKECHPNCDCGRFLEFGNSVFIEYEKLKDGKMKALPNKNVDFGGGLERITAACQNQPDMFQIDLFSPLISEIEKSSKQKYIREHKAPMRIIADHLRAAVFMAQQGLEPGNKKQAYVMRRLIRRAAVKMQKLAIPFRQFIPKICGTIIDLYGDLYFDKRSDEIHSTIGKEIDSFEGTINKGTKLLQTKQINDKLLFDLYQTYGFPLEISQEILAEEGRPISKQDIKGFKKEKKKHQQLSRTASVGMFKGGLADHSEEITKLHTATHLLHKALIKILGDHVKQEGSNITAERLRFDFSHSQALTENETKQVEDLINQKIKEDLAVHKTAENKNEALASGALAFFREKYPTKVTVFTIGQDPNTDWWSKELCGGPHVVSTGKIGSVRIKKQEAVGRGKRRLYVVLNK